MDEELIEISSPILLSALLKKVRFVQSGGEAKQRIRNGEVKINGKNITTPSTLAGSGDLVTIRGKQYRLVIKGK